MGQRLGLAAALLGDPPILVLDEPVNGLDPAGIAWIRGLLRSLAHEGRAVLLSSHLMSELEGTADHLIIIGRGRMIADTTVDALLTAASGNRLEVRTSHKTAAITALANAGAVVTDIDRELLTVTGLDGETTAGVLNQAGVPFSELRRHRATLEEAYMDLTRDQGDFVARDPRRLHPPWTSRP
jgi:ABC-2 type transport system ATP-binding protein